MVIWIIVYLKVSGCSFRPFFLATRRFLPQNYHSLVFVFVPFRVSQKKKNFKFPKNPRKITVQYLNQLIWHQKPCQITDNTPPPILWWWPEFERFALCCCRQGTGGWMNEGLIKNDGWSQNNLPTSYGNWHLRVILPKISVMPVTGAVWHASQLRLLTVTSWKKLNLENGYWSQQLEQNEKKVEKISVRSSPH